MTKASGIARRRALGHHAAMEAGEYAAMDAAEDRMWWYRALHERLIAALRPARGCVLDAGCGTGGLLARLGAERPELARFGVEWDGAAASRAAAKSGASVVRGSVNALPWGDSAFDAVVSADVLCHRAVDPPQALAELHRVLRPGGMLVLNLPAYAWLMSAHDAEVHNARRFAASEVRRMLAAHGFAQARLRYWNGLLLPVLAARRKWRDRGGTGSDVAVLPPFLDACLYGVTRLERGIKLPAGSSILAVARRR